MQCVFESIAASGIMERKSPKVTLRRWFSWVHAMKQFLPEWHSLLLTICYSGLKTGAFAKDDLPIHTKVDIEAAEQPAGNDDEAGGVGSEGAPNASDRSFSSVLRPATVGEWLAPSVSGLGRYYPELLETARSSYSFICRS